MGDVAFGARPSASSCARGRSRSLRRRAVSWRRSSEGEIGGFSGGVPDRFVAWNRGEFPTSGGDLLGTLSV